MEIASGAKPPTLRRDPQASPWTRTVAVIRVPRFAAFRRTCHARVLPDDDPLSEFTAEAELEATYERGSVRRIFDVWRERAL